MAPRSKASRRREHDSDPMEALKPLLVLGLLGTILYGAYSIVQRGPTAAGPAWQPPSSPVAATATDAPPFQAPAVEMQPPAATAAAVTSPAVSPTPFPAPPGAGGGLPTTGAGSAPAAVPPPPPSRGVVAPPAVVETAPDQPPTYLTAQAAAPPVDVPPAPQSRPGPLPVESPARLSPAPSVGGPGAAAAFASDWAEAHDKLASGRYAEALAVLSVWYDDTSLGVEESQRLEDLLGQLAGTVIYSQQDLLLPPHVVAAGESLQAIAAPLGVPWQLLAKINGVEDPAKLVPGEQLKVVRGPFDAVVSISRGRLSLQVGGNYAGSFPVIVGRQVQERVGASLAVVDVRRGGQPAPAGPGGPAQVAYMAAGNAAIVLGDGLSIEAVEDPSLIADRAPSTSLVVAAGDLDEIVDILGPGSHVLVRK